MAKTPDQRRVARVTVPRHSGGAELELHLVRIVDLSALGARIEHLEPMHEGVVCYVDLPPSIKRVRLTGRIVWTKISANEQTVEGERRRHHESGIEFTDITPEQQADLGTVLEKLQAASDTPDQKA